MSADISMSGGLFTLRSILRKFKELTEYRKAQGWEPYQPDEEWLYNTQVDSFVCPTCSRRQGHSDGTALREYTEKRWIEYYRVMYPNTHAEAGHEYSPGSERCRCRLYWENYPDILRERLLFELMERNY